MKIYVIIHDATNLLIGIGGKSGKVPTTRQGYHLPGGTIDRNESALAAASRELREETGIELEFTDSNSYSFSMKLDDMDVSFLVARVESVNALTRDFHRPAVTNEHDEPFESLEIIELHNCWLQDGFSNAYKTNWFGDGLKEAKTKGFLQ